MNDTKTVKRISECFVKPQHITEEMKQPCYLSPWDLAMLSVNYIQEGLLFTKPQHHFIKPYLEKLKHSLSLTLVHFYPLAGRLATVKNDSPPSYVVFVDCNNSPGAKFIYSSVDMSISDVRSATYVPLVVQSFFDHDRAINDDGHTESLLSIQVTELLDGIFIGCSMNHVLADGTSFWNFFNRWSEIFQNVHVPISRPPIINRWFPDGVDPIINLPFTHQDEFIFRYEAPQVKERIFHFTSESIARLKAKANKESNTNTNEISSFQSLSALVWRCITRARRLPKDQLTSCRLAINDRSRLDPPLSQDYFGNSINVVTGIATAGELVEHDLGWAAWKLREAVANHTDKEVREWVEMWLKSPFVYRPDQFFDPNSVAIGSSPRFNKYGNEFGLGKAVALCSGHANKFDGTVSGYPGREGGGSVDLEVCLLPEFMTALESNHEFMEAVSISGENMSNNLNVE